MGIQNASHAYNFTVSGSTVNTDELIIELEKAKTAIGGPSVCSFSYHAGNQRDPSTLTVTVRAGRSR